jgi:hypothetical protein
MIPDSLGLSSMGIAGNLVLQIPHYASLRAVFHRPGFLRDGEEILTCGKKLASTGEETMILVVSARIIQIVIAAIRPTGLKFGFPETTAFSVSLYHNKPRFSSQAAGTLWVKVNDSNGFLYNFVQSKNPPEKGGSFVREEAQTIIRQ